MTKVASLPATKATNCRGAQSATIPSPTSLVRSTWPRGRRRETLPRKAGANLGQNLGALRFTRNLQNAGGLHAFYASVTIRHDKTYCCWKREAQRFVRISPTINMWSSWCICCLWDPCGLFRSQGAPSAHVGYGYGAGGARTAKGRTRARLVIGALRGP